MSTASHQQPWIHSPLADSLWVIGPMWLPAALVILFPAAFASAEVSPWMWLLLVVGVDVAHVWSTLYRTYFDPLEFQKYKALLIAVPLLCWVAGALLYAAGPLVFWRCAAYLAVFHFVRQQYGFFSIYARAENRDKRERLLDGAAIYAATLFPIVWWHCQEARAFHWFVDGDFFTASLPWLSRAALLIYVLILATYVVKEGMKWKAGRALNLPKNAVLAGTAITWLTGIVLYNGDLAFTLTNVVSHGLPYLALIWFYGRRRNDQLKETDARPPLLRRLFTLKGLPIFLSLLLLLAFAEEALWDSTVWRDHPAWFQWAYDALPQLSAADTLAWVVPLLAVPQLTHYVIDGFIWRLRRDAIV